MTVLEKFVAFAALPDDRRARIEELLSDIMEAEAGGWELSGGDIAELERRVADPDPEYASPEEVEAFFARYRAS